MEQFEFVGVAAATDAIFDVELLKHSDVGWTYSLAAFQPGGSELITRWSDVHVTERELANGEAFAFKRSDLAVPVQGSADEGVIVRITTGATNSVQSMNIFLGGIVTL